MERYKGGGSKTLTLGTMQGDIVLYIDYTRLSMYG